MLLCNHERYSQLHNNSKVKLGAGVRDSSTHLYAEYQDVSIEMGMYVDGVLPQ